MIPINSHTFVNEDNRIFNHPGYVLAHCKRCGAEYPIVRGYTNDLGFCRDPKCDRNFESQQGAKLR
jgi:hypothetical protein